MLTYYNNIYDKRNDGMLTKYNNIYHDKDIIIMIIGMQRRDVAELRGFCWNHASL